LASGLTAFVALLALLVAGPRDVATLTARSHIFGLSLAPLISKLHGLSWAEIDVLALLVCCAAGLLLSAVMAQIFGWGKSARAVRSVRTARLTALALQRGERWDALPPPVTVPAMPAMPALPSVPSARGAASFGVAAPFSGAKAELALPEMLSAAGLPPLSFAAEVAAANAPVAQRADEQRSAELRGVHAKVRKGQGSNMPAVAAPTQAAASIPSDSAQLRDTQSPAGPGEPAKRGSRRKTSQARPVEGQLTREMRQALEDWARRERQDAPQDKQQDDDPAETPTAARSGRTRQPSTFLNSAGAAPPKRNRKKNQTRDWLC
jgi:hypothetical protein